MASTEIVTMTDDLDPRIESGVETVTFFDPSTGEKREIELGEANRKHFANHLEKLVKYIEASRLVEVAKPAKVAPVKSNVRNVLVRAWAQANGFKIGDRGRIKAEIFDAYDKAHNDSAVVPTQTVTPAAEVKADEIAQEIAVKAAESEPEAVIAEVATPVDPKPTEDGYEVSEPADLTDADILEMMAELEAEKGQVEIDDLLDKANGSE